MRLKELRVSENLSQNEIAKQIGLKQFTYSNYETGVTEPKIQTLIDLADYYGVSLDYLVGRNFNNEFGYIAEKDKDALRLFLSLTDQNKLKAAAFIAGLLATQN